MVIVSILVVMVSGIHRGRTHKANMMRHRSNLRLLEDMSEQYYIQNDMWPNIKGEYYTKEEIMGFCEGIIDYTGNEVELDDFGRYYDIDYTALLKHLKVYKEDQKYYIIQNPVGKVYYMCGLNSMGENRVRDPIKEIGELMKDGYIPIASAYELNNLRFNQIQIFGVGTEWEGEYESGLDKKYIQVQDVDFNEHEFEGGWTPIGNNNDWVTGIYNGNNFIIKNLELSIDNTHVGLFGYANKAIFENIIINDIDVNGNNYVGGLVGSAFECQIKDVKLSGNIIGGECVGGLIGKSYKNLITRISGDVHVKGKDNIGGMIGCSIYSNMDTVTCEGDVEGTGDNTGGIIGLSECEFLSNLEFEGSVEGDREVGGIAGVIYNGIRKEQECDFDDIKDLMNGEMRNSRVEGYVTGRSEVGGLVGSAYGAIILESHTMGQVEGTEDNIGGLVGYLFNGERQYGDSYWGEWEKTQDGKINDCYSECDVSGYEAVGGSVGFADGCIIKDSSTLGHIVGEIK